MAFQKLLYPIADALKMELKHNDKYEVQGECKVQIPGTPLTLPMKVEASFYDKDQSTAGVLCKTKGKLWVLVSYNQSTDRLSCAIVNSDKLSHVPSTSMAPFLKPTASLLKVWGYLKPGLVKVFYRSAKEANWHEQALKKAS